MNDFIQILSSIVVGGVGYKFTALAYQNRFKNKDIQMDLISELRAEIKELRERVDKVQAELDSCKPHQKLKSNLTPIGGFGLLVFHPNTAFTLMAVTSCSSR